MRSTARIHKPALVVALALALAIAPALAQPRGMGHGPGHDPEHMLEMLTERLDLTESQQASLTERQATARWTGGSGGSAPRARDPYARTRG